jgi:hypothetical protein
VKVYRGREVVRVTIQCSPQFQLCSLQSSSTLSTLADKYYILLVKCMT